MGEYIMSRRYASLLGACLQVKWGSLGEAGEPLYSVNYRFSTKSLIKDFPIEFEAALTIHEYLPLHCITSHVKWTLAPRHVPRICKKRNVGFAVFFSSSESGDGTQYSEVPWCVWILDQQPCMHRRGVQSVNLLSRGGHMVLDAHRSQQWSWLDALLQTLPHVCAYTLIRLFFLHF